MMEPPSSGGNTPCSLRVAHLVLLSIKAWKDLVERAGFLWEGCSGVAEGATKNTYVMGHRKNRKVG